MLNPDGTPETNPGGASTSASTSASASTAANADQHGAAPALPPEFPAGLRVLLVEDDLVSSSIVSRMLEKCRYQVTACKSPEAALAMLRRGRRQSFDLVLSDVNMANEDGFKLLESIGWETDLPVIMMSNDEQTDAVSKGIMHGACDYLVKPVRLEILKNIWQHVARKKKHTSKNQQSEDDEQEQIRARAPLEDGDNASPRCDTQRNAEACEDPSHHVKKQRFVWTQQKHQEFIDAVQALGSPEKAFPKKILEIMDDPNLTRENVASHLQKYRINLKKEEEHKKWQQEIAIFNGANGFNSQAYSSSQIMPPSLIQPEAVNTYVDTSVNVNQVALNVQVPILPMQQGNNRLSNHLINRATGINIVDLRQYEHRQPSGNTVAFPEHHDLTFPRNSSHQRSLNHFSSMCGANVGACTTLTGMNGANVGACTTLTGMNEATSAYTTLVTGLNGANPCASTTFIGNHANASFCPQFTDVQNLSTIGSSKDVPPWDQLQSEMLSNSHQSYEASFVKHQQDSIWGIDNEFENSNIFMENSYCTLNTNFNEPADNFNEPVDMANKLKENGGQP